MIKIQEGMIVFLKKEVKEKCRPGWKRYCGNKEKPLEVLYSLRDKVHLRFCDNWSIDGVIDGWITRTEFWNYFSLLKHSIVIDFKE